MSNLFVKKKKKEERENRIYKSVVRQQMRDLAARINERDRAKS